MKQFRWGVNGLLLCVPTLVAAQTTQAGSKIRIAQRTSAFTANSCRAMASMPSALTGTDEGMAIIKMQHELAVASENINVRRDTLGQSETRRMMVLRRTLDSIAMDFARSQGPAEAGEGRGLNAVGSRGNVEMRLREIEPQVTFMVRGGVMSPIADPSRPRGYLGVTSSGLSISPMTPTGEKIVGYCDYPRVETIDPGSPAEKAGLQTGDTLLAFNGHDLREFEVNYTQLLVPGQTMRIAYRRGGRRAEIPVVVTQSPDSGEKVFITKVICAPDEPRASCEGRTVAGMRGNFTFRGAIPGGSVQGGSGSGSGVVNGVAMAGGNGSPPPPRAGMIVRTISPDFPISSLPGAGPESALLLDARVLAISEEIAAGQGGEPGVLIVNVPQPSRAFENGLRAGDLITDVNGTAVRDIVGLKRLIMRPGPHVATLQLINKKTGARSIEIHW